MEEIGEFWIAKGEQTTGPFSLEKITEMFKSGELQVTDMIWYNGLETWQQAQNIKQLQDIIPQWYVVAEASQERKGPLTVLDIHKMLSDKRLTSNAYCWKTGFRDWVKVSETLQFGPNIPMPTLYINPTRSEVYGKKDHKSEDEA